MKQNLLGEPLQTCSHMPLTGFYRDGLCRTDEHDRGRHVVCAQMTEHFLDFSKAQGNDLSTPIQPHFPGLKPGDFWCLCALRWIEAYQAGLAPKIRFAATDQALLQYIDMASLRPYALDIN
ncbi:DUF2237 family protein [Thiomicrospira cyclica]|uniref:DUF2237 domain-containing protein n=1 Tax=Thiomicrospira cyclica (strain DSM 14477 / JCM 11371 / ALM1) TaxID=717773 RepID=F6DAF3_THICA|nr:DUF2237 domain-containing protein [Thiomicrospira cyclica]AEG31119.1 Protein of unknown function DUF2237 [Thiomicrospira cyclica ALM1]